MKKKLIGTSLLALTAGIGGKITIEAYEYGKKALYRDSFSDVEVLDNDDFKRIKIRNHKGLLLQGYLLEVENADKTLLIAHPFMESSVVMEPYVAFFKRILKNMNILLIDANAHGNSDGYIRGFGYRDITDLMFWNSYILQKFGQNHSIIMYGLEMGANTILNTAGMKKLKNVKAIISEGAYTSVYHYLAYRFAKNMKTMHAIAPFIRMAIKNEIDQDIKKMNTVTLVKSNDIPTVFIHSKADKRVDFSQVLQLFNNNASDKELFPIKENYLFELEGLNDEYSRSIEEYIIKVCN